MLAYVANGRLRIDPGLGSKYQEGQRLSARRAHAERVPILRFVRLLLCEYHVERGVSSRAVRTILNEDTHVESAQLLVLSVGMCTTRPNSKGDPISYGQLNLFARGVDSGQVGGPYMRSSANL